MPVFKRKDIPKLLKDIDQGNISQIYFLFGERFLCRNAADELILHLLPPEEYDDVRRPNHLQDIDGDQEDVGRTLNLLRTYSLFPGRRIIRVSDTKLFYSKGVTKTLWEKANKAFAVNEFNLAGRFLGQLLNLANLSSDDLAAEDISSLSSPRWKEVFGFAKPQQDLSWLRTVRNHCKIETDADGGRHESGDAAETYMKAFQGGIPNSNILVLLAEAVDKRKRFYTYIKENGVIVDLAVDSGGGTAAQKDRESIFKDLVTGTLADFDKKLEPRALPVLLERVGFHPVAVVKETEKLALYAGESATITLNDLDAVIGRTREEALYELTEAYTKQRLAAALTILAHLLENGFHGLAILASFRNQIKKMLLIRSFQELKKPLYKPGLSFPAFQKSYLPELKADRGDWSSLWRSHPYALYKTFRQSERFSRGTLERGLKRILNAEYRIKGSVVADRLILEDLFFKLIPVSSQ